MPLLPFIRKYFDLDLTRASYVTSSFSMANGFGQLPAGWLADRIGPRILITVGILGVGIAGILVGLSRTYVMLLVFLVLMGLMAGGYHPAASPLISASVEPNQRGRALGFHLIGGNASFFLAPMVAGATATAWDWRGSFLVLAVPSALFGIFFFIFLTRRAYQAQASRRGPGEETPPPTGYKRRLTAFLLLSVLGGGAAMSMNTFISLYAVDELGASEEVAASLFSIMFFSGLWAGPLGGYISDRVGRVPVIIVCGLASALFLFSLRFFSMLGIGFYTVLFFMGLNNTVRMPVSEAFIMGQAPARRRSTIYGIYYFTMQEAGAVFAPIMSLIMRSQGYHYGFTVAGIAVVVVTVTCALFLRGSED